MAELLTKVQSEEALTKVPGWELSADKKWIVLECVMKNFAAAIDFVQKIAVVAEDIDHHPDIHLTGYCHLSVHASTHAAGGLTEKDFNLAAKINALSAEFKDDPYQK